MAVHAPSESTLPALVLLPGTLCDARVFAPMLEHAALGGALAGRDIHPGDMTGLGSAREIAQRVLSTIPARFIPVGFSLGAIVALEMAAMTPERLAGMVLIAANGRDVPLADHPARRAAATQDPARLVGEVLWDRSVADGNRHDAILRETVIAMACAQPAGTLALQTEVALSRSDKRALLPGLPMPALVLGGLQDRIAPPELQREIAAALPDATLALTPDGGHFLPLECPVFCARALTDWLAQANALA